MGDWKMTCPGCNAWTNAVGYAYRDGDPCPECGLPHSATEAVLTARKSSADEKLRAEYERVVVEWGKVTAECEALRARLRAVDDAMEGWKP